MLKELTIENYILIDKLSLLFDDGLTVLTGESGAGKSIILNAIKLCLGDKSSKDIIRDPSKKAKFELVFESDDIYVITREVFPSGRSISRLNGDVISISELMKVTEKLIDLFSQKEHNYLLDKSNQVSFIDSYAGDDHKKVLQDIEAVYTKRLALLDRLKTLENDSSSFDDIVYEYEEISKLGIDLDKDSTLDDEYKKIVHISEIRDSVYSLREHLDQSVETIYKATDITTSIREYDELFESLSDRLTNSYYDIKDVYEEILNYHVEEYDASYIREVEERISEIEYLKKKYSRDLESLYQYQLLLKDRIDQFHSKDDLMNGIRLEIKQEEKHYFELSEKLKVLRQNAFETINKELTNILKEVSINNAKFKLVFEKTTYREGGLYDAEIYAALNNLGYKPLKDIASGGELSRIMLALKTIYTKSEGIKCIFFDEIDSGISGKSAFEVGAKIKEISTNNQVVSITHLPQIACYADQHILVTKKGSNTQVKTIDKNEHVERIAFMMSSVVTDRSVASAKELISRALKG